MSGYSDIEALWLTRVRAVAGFDANNTSRGDWNILNSGASEVYVILKPGSHSRDMLTWRNRQNVWQTIIEMWQLYRNDGTTLTTLEANYNTLLAALDQYPRLGDTGNTVQQGQVTAVNEVVQSPPDAPQWLVAQLIGTVNEEITINFQE